MKSKRRTRCNLVRVFSNYARAWIPCSQEYYIYNIKYIVCFLYFVPQFFKHIQVWLSLETQHCKNPSLTFSWKLCIEFSLTGNLLRLGLDRKCFQWVPVREARSCQSPVRSACPVVRWPMSLRWVTCVWDLSINEHLLLRVFGTSTQHRGVLSFL